MAEPLEVKKVPTKKIPTIKTMEKNDLNNIETPTPNLKQDEELELSEMKEEVNEEKVKDGLTYEEALFNLTKY